MLAGGSGWMHVLQAVSRFPLFRSVASKPVPSCMSSSKNSLQGSKWAAEAMHDLATFGLLLWLCIVAMQYLPGLGATLALIMTNCIRR